jgi:hypothetical protein
MSTTASVMFHIFLVSETLITGLCHLQYNSALLMSPLWQFHNVYGTSDMIPHCLCFLQYGSTTPIWPSSIFYTINVPWKSLLYESAIYITSNIVLCCLQHLWAYSVPSMPPPNSLLCDSAAVCICSSTATSGQPRLIAQQYSFCSQLQIIRWRQIE